MAPSSEEAAEACAVEIASVSTTSETTAAADAKFKKLID